MIPPVYPNLTQIGYPIGKARLISAIITGCLVGVFLYFATTNLKWLTLTRQIYFLFGVSAGLALGLLEAKIVIPKLAKETETFVWQVIPVATALFTIPLLLAVLLFGTAEYLPFMLYAFFPFIPAFLAASGWYYTKYEQGNRVTLFVFAYGFKYWKQPNPDQSDRFYYFIRDVVTREFSSLAWHMGYSISYIRELEKKESIDPQTRMELLRVLKKMSSYRKIVLGGFALFLIAGFTLFALFFANIGGLIKLNIDILKILGPLSGAIFAFLVSIYIVLQMFRRKVAKMLSAIDPDKLASISA